MSAKTVVTYHLPLTYLTVTGAMTERTDLATGERGYEVTADVDVGVQADPDDYYRLDLDASGLTDSDFALTLTDDRRLATASGTSTGQAGTVLSGVAKIVGAAASGIAPFPLPLRKTFEGAAFALQADVGASKLDESDDGANEPEVLDQTSRPGPPEYPMKDRLDKVRAAATEMADATIEVSKAAIAGTKTDAELKAAIAGLEMVRNELANIERHYGAWRAHMVDEVVTHHAFRLTISELLPLGAVQGHTRDAIPMLGNDAPTDAVVRPGDSQEEQGLKAARLQQWRHFRALRSMADELKMIVAHDTTIEKGPDSGLSRGHLLDQIVFRRPHYTDLVLLRESPDGYQIVSRMTALVMSDRSYTSTLEFEKSAWSKKKLAVEFSELGSVTGIATGESSAVAEAIAAAAGLPANLSAGMKSTGSLADQVEAGRNQRITHAVARIDLEKKLLAAQAVEESSDPASDAIVAEIAELELTKKRLTLLKEIGELETAT